MSANSDYRVEDRLKITEVLYAYCRGVDRIDLDVLRDVFEPDAKIAKGNGEVALPDWLIYIAEKHPAIPRTSHMVTNYLIDFTGADSAFVESWCLAVEQHPASGPNGEDVDHVVRVRYADSFKLRDGTWRIATRAYIMDHVMSAIVRDDLIPDFGLRYQGIRGPADLASTQRRKALGLD